MIPACFSDLIRNVLEIFQALFNELLAIEDFSRGQVDQGFLKVLDLAVGLRVLRRSVNGQTREWGNL